MVVPPKHPKMIIFSRKPMIVGYHHFRNPPYRDYKKPIWGSQFLFRCGLNSLWRHCQPPALLGSLEPSPVTWLRRACSGGFDKRLASPRVYPKQEESTEIKEIQSWEFKKWKFIDWVVVSNILYFHPNLGDMIQFDEHIFQMGWFNHQLIDIFWNIASFSDPTITIHGISSLNVDVFLRSLPVVTISRLLWPVFSKRLVLLIGDGSFRVDFLGVFL